MFRTVITSAALVLAALTGSAQAQERIQAGSLTCDVSAGIGLIIGSQRNVSCTFTPSVARADRVLHRHDLQARRRHRRHRGRRSWSGSSLLRPTARLARWPGNYVGGSAEASVVAGIGANALVGGSNRSVALQPLSVLGPGRPQYRGRSRRARSALRALTLNARRRQVTARPCRAVCFWTMGVRLRGACRHLVERRIAPAATNGTCRARHFSASCQCPQFPETITIRTPNL